MQIIAAMLAAAVVGLAGSAGAETRTSGMALPGGSAALIVPDAPKAAVVLLSGGDGRIGVGADGSIRRASNFLVRTRAMFADKGLAVLVPDAGVDVGAAVAAMARYGRVTLVGTSRGTQRAAAALAAGSRPDRLVLSSGFLSDASGAPENVAAILGDPGRLPPTLVVHHRDDTCRVTRAAGVAPFLAWAAGKASVAWIEGGVSVGPACQAMAHHGFNGAEPAAVAAIARFALK